MSLPSEVAKKYLARFASLISEGEAIQQSVVITPGEYYEDVFRKTHQHSPRHKMDWERLVR